MDYIPPVSKQAVARGPTIAWWFHAMDRFSRMEIDFSKIDEVFLRKRCVLIWRCLFCFMASTIMANTVTAGHHNGCSQSNQICRIEARLFGGFFHRFRFLSIQPHLLSNPEVSSKDNIICIRTSWAFFSLLTQYVFSFLPETRPIAV